MIEVGLFSGAVPTTLPLNFLTPSMPAGGGTAAPFRLLSKYCWPFGPESSPLIFTHSAS